eukprot:INCI3780.1.p1 GENE.INCI3780.1~~INCI3780.1.p1  ORF type:complete len:1321 (+),score=209.92 INCI3780.1:176-4138(+)
MDGDEKTAKPVSGDFGDGLEPVASPMSMKVLTRRRSVKSMPDSVSPTRGSEKPPLPPLPRSPAHGLTANNGADLAAAPATRRTADPSISPASNDEGYAVLRRSSGPRLRTHRTATAYEDAIDLHLDPHDSGPQSRAHPHAPSLQTLQGVTEGAHPEDSAIAARRQLLQRGRERHHRKRRRRLKTNRQYVFLPGEKVLVENVECEIRIGVGSGAAPMPARLAITDFALVFGAAPHCAFPIANQYAVVPLLSLEKLTRSDEGGGKHHVNDAEDIGDESDEGGGDAPGGGARFYAEDTTKMRLNIECKDSREFELRFVDDTLAEGCYQLIKDAWATPEDRLFAMLHPDPSLLRENAEKVLCDVEGETILEAEWRRLISAATAFDARLAPKARQSVATASPEKPRDNGSRPSSSASKKSFWAKVENSSFVEYPSYPPSFYVPDFVSTASQMKDIASFRSKKRVPAMTWTCAHSGVSLVRCAQPMVGASGERCPADESMLNSLRLRDLRNSATRHRDFCTGLISSNLSGVLLPEPVISNGNHLRSRSAGTNVDAGKIASGMGSDASSVAAARGALAASRDYSQSMLVEAPHPSSVLAAPNAAHGPEMHKILIVDCRPRANAMANMAKGGGTESTKNYRDAELVYLKIDNIHGVRKAYRAFRHLLATKLGFSGHWLRHVDDTDWLSMLRRILKGAGRVAHAMARNKQSVVCHCSDGWDRTAQVCALAQILVDPHYRTVKGFIALVEKDWLAFGHKFQDRVGHGVKAQNNNEYSQVFLQFLDCVWQLMNMYPNDFEYNDQLLLIIADALHSCRFGTFLGNNERDRVMAATATKTSCLWAYILQPVVLARCVKPAPWIDARRCLVPARIVDFETLMSRRVTVWPGYWHRFLPAVVDEQLRVAQSIRNRALGRAAEVSTAECTPIQPNFVSIEKVLRDVASGFSALRHHINVSCPIGSSTPDRALTANAEGDAEFDGANEAFVDTSLEGDTASVDDEDDGPSSDAKLHVLSAHTLLEKIAAKLAQLQSDQHNLHNKFSALQASLADTAASSASSFTSQALLQVQALLTNGQVEPVVGTPATSGLSVADHAGLKQLHFHNDSLLNGGTAYAVANVDGGDSSSSSDCSDFDGVGDRDGNLRPRFLMPTHRKTLPVDARRGGGTGGNSSDDTDEDGSGPSAGGGLHSELNDFCGGDADADEWRNSSSANNRRTSTQGSIRIKKGIKTLLARDRAKHKRVEALLQGRAWVDERSKDNCMQCQRAFNVFNRKHHCRFCGSVVCAGCSKFRMNQSRVDLNGEETLKSVRACATCFARDGGSGGGGGAKKKKSPFK